MFVNVEILVWCLDKCQGVKKSRYHFKDELLQDAYIVRSRRPATIKCVTC